MRRGFFALLCLLVQPPSTSAEVTRVTVTSRARVADGQSFGSTGAYEWLVGRIDFALDPADPHNVGIVDLDRARRDADGRVRFSADLQVLRLLQEDMDDILTRARAHWNYATRAPDSPTARRP